MSSKRSLATKCGRKRCLNDHNIQNILRILLLSFQFKYKTHGGEREECRPNGGHVQSMLPMICATSEQKPSITVISLLPFRLMRYRALNALEHSSELKFITSFYSSLMPNEWNHDTIFYCYVNAHKHKNYHRPPVSHSFDNYSEKWLREKCEKHWHLMSSKLEVNIN